MGQIFHTWLYNSLAFMAILCMTWSTVASAQTYSTHHPRTITEVENAHIIESLLSINDTLSVAIYNPYLVEGTEMGTFFLPDGQQASYVDFGDGQKPNIWYGLVGHSSTGIRESIESRAPVRVIFVLETPGRIMVGYRIIARPLNRI